MYEITGRCVTYESDNIVSFHNVLWSVKNLKIISINMLLFGVMRRNKLMAHAAREC